MSKGHLLIMGIKEKRKNQSNGTYNVTFTIQLTQCLPLNFSKKAHIEGFAQNDCAKPQTQHRILVVVVWGGDNTVPFTKIQNAHTFGMAFHSKECTKHILIRTPSDAQKAVNGSLL